VWALELSKAEENIISVVNDGLKSGAIAVPGAAGLYLLPGCRGFAPCFFDSMSRSF
jgi:hypothetical protein